MYGTYITEHVMEIYIKKKKPFCTVFRSHRGICRKNAIFLDARFLAVKTQTTERRRTTTERVRVVNKAAKSPAGAS